MECCSLEYKSHAPPELSRLNLIWSVKYKHSKHKSKPTEKKNRIEETHMIYIFQPYSFPEQTLSESPMS